MTPRPQNAELERKACGDFAPELAELERKALR